MAGGKEGEERKTPKTVYAWQEEEEEEEEEEEGEEEM